MTRCPHKRTLVRTGCCTECGEKTRLGRFFIGEVDSLDPFNAIEVRRILDHGVAGYAELVASVEQVRILARAAWVRSLPLIEDGMSWGDYARTCGMLPPKPGKRAEWTDAVCQAACERLALEYPVP